MIKTTIKVFLLLVLVACNLTRHASNSIESSIQVEVNNNKIIQAQDPIQFEIRNISSEIVTLIHPEKISIEKSEGESWTKLKILDCPCDAPCQPKPEKELLNPGKSIILNWNQKESWCGSRSANTIRETIYKEVGSGSYRLLIRMMKDGKESTFYKNFNISI